MADDSLTGLGKVNASKVDFNYAIDDLSEVSYIEIGNEIRKFANQKAPYFDIVSQIVELGPVRSRQTRMAAKFKTDLNYYVLSPEFDYKQPAYLLSYPGHGRIKVHSMELEQTRDHLIEEALRLQQRIIQAGDIDIEADDAGQNTFTALLDAKTFGIGPKSGSGKIHINTGNPREFIESLLDLFKLRKSTTIVKGASSVLIKKFLPDFMTVM